MEWVRNLWKSSAYRGTFVKLAKPTDNFSKLTIFQHGSIRIQSRTLIIINNDYDSSQDQLPAQEFPLLDEMFFTEYSFTEGSQIVYGLKWRGIGQVLGNFGFEFESLADRHRFTKSVPNSVTIEDEGHQKTRESPENAESLHRLVASSPPAGPPEETTAEFQVRALKTLEPLYSADQILYISAGNLFRVDPGTGFAEQVEAGLGFLLVKHPDFIFSFDVVRATEIAMRCLLSAKFHYEILVANRKVNWVDIVPEVPVYWQMQLCDDVSPLTNLCRFAQFETSRQQCIADLLTAEEQNWLAGSGDSSREESGSDESLSWSGTDEPVNSEDILDSTLGVVRPISVLSTPQKLKLYSVESGSFSCCGEIPVSLDPKNLLLHQQDSKVLMLNPEDQANVYSVDLHRGDVVEHWSVNGAAKLTALSSATKFNSSDDTFYAMSERSLFVVDPRVSTPNKGVVTKTYATNPRFSAFASTEDGHVVCGSKTGELRLYKTLGQIAKTHLPGLGDPILSVDSTKAGDWVLATCARYLVVIPTVSHGINGFRQGLGKKKRKPRRLCLTVKDIIRYDLKEICFTPARFDLNTVQEETVIITSTGSYLVIWNFNAVKKGRYSNYIIKEASDTVLKNEFRVNEENFVVTHPQSIQYQRNKVRFHSK